MEPKKLLKRICLTHDSLKCNKIVKPSSIRFITNRIGDVFLRKKREIILNFA